MNKCCILLSYPRCANSWLRFCIENISHRPTYPDNDYIKEIRKHINVSGDYILRKEHSLYEKDRIYGKVATNKDVYNKSKLILLLRNYKECVIKQKQDYNDVILGQNKSPYNYMENINEYHKWPRDKKLLIYYEDLIMNPKKELLKCVKFLNLKEKNLNFFMDKYDFYKKISVESYDLNTQKGSSTKGEHLRYHSINSGIDFKEWDDKIIEKHSDLFNKYLIRYKEN